MKKAASILIITLILSSALCAQTFIDKAVIEFEVKANLKKTLGNNMWSEMMKENLPTFKTGYYTFTFADNKSVYKWNHWDDKKIPDYLRKQDEDDVWFTDYNIGKVSNQKNIIGSMFNVEDSITKLEWRITTESRNIAGFNCRKAVTKMFDSVYVFAFYTDEIMIPGGPASINGLPGMILGVTIPRLFTSFIATKVSVNGVDVASIKPVTAKKYLSTAALKTMITDRTKDWWSGDGDTEENRQQKNRFLWTVFL